MEVARRSGGSEKLWRREALEAVIEGSRGSGGGVASRKTRWRKGVHAREGRRRHHEITVFLIISNFDPADGA